MPQPHTEVVEIGDVEHLAPDVWVRLARADRVCTAADDAVVDFVRRAGIEVTVGDEPRDGDVWLATDPSVAPGTGALAELTRVMDRLRSECPWDAEQTHASLVRYLVEESYEVIEAIDALDDSPEARAHLREELGDLLLQVMFHARIAAEHPTGPFDIDDVARGIVTKLVRRHPHVFADVQVAGADDVAANWEQIKAAEKQREHPLDGIPPGLPSLAYADKVVSRALRSDLVLSLPTPEGVADYDAETLGDVLFALVAAGNAAGIDPEQALRHRVQREVRDLRG